MAQRHLQGMISRIRDVLQGEDSPDSRSEGSQRVRVRHASAGRAKAGGFKVYESRLPDRDFGELLSLRHDGSGIWEQGEALSVVAVACILSDGLARLEWILPGRHRR